MLAKKAWERAKSSKAKLSERVVSAGVAGIMAAKSKMGMGLKRKRKRTIKKQKPRKKQRGSGIRRRHRTQPKKRASKKKKKRNGLNKTTPTITPNQTKITVKKLYNEAVKSAKQVIAAKKPKPTKNAVILAKKAAQAIVKKNKTLNKAAIKTGLPRIIPIPKQEGGAIPIFAALSALGALMGGTAGIVSAITSAKDARNQYNNNETMEATTIGKKLKGGYGLFLGPYPHRNGSGLFLSHINDISKN